MCAAAVAQPITSVALGRTSASFVLPPLIVVVAVAVVVLVLLVVVSPS